MWGSGHSVEGEPVFQGMKVGLEGMDCLIVLSVLGGYSEIIGIRVEFDMWSCGVVWGGKLM